jgi:DNA mismatch repair protein MutS2
MGEDLLEFSALKEFIRSFVVSDVGLGALDDLCPFDTWGEAKKRWAMLEEMMDIISSPESLVVSSIPDIRELLGIHDGALLEGQDIVTVAQVLRESARIKRRIEETGECLCEITSGIEKLSSLTAQIDAMILPTGEISDAANPILRDLRRRYKSCRTMILEKLQNMIDQLRDKSVLMDDIITKRNERYVICLRLDYTGQMKGITHDYSRTNRTAYVEPLAIIEENNTLNQLRADIIEEENQVLRDLTEQIRGVAPVIENNLARYGLIDLINACARWSIKNHATIPHISADGVRLEAARHPLLLERLGTMTVPLDITIPRGKDCLIITGPNAGGKTVALKTLGLVVVMAKSGLAIPAGADSEIAPFGKVWVAMDTNQDIEHDLSSFTAHALALKHIYTNVSQGDLVLLDEPGSGTDPSQGGAIAVSCIDAMRKRGACVVATSHSDLIKLYGVSSPGVENAATAFDETGMKPLYRLQYGVIGQSRAFEILEAIDFPREILAEASGIISRDTHSALAQAMEDISQASSMRKQAAFEREEATRLKENAKRALDEIEQDKITCSLKYKRLIAQVEELVKRPRPKKVIHEVLGTPVARELEQILEETDAPEVLKIQKGSIVKLKGTETTGEVHDLWQETAEVLFGDKRMKVGLEQIEAVDQCPEKTAQRKNLRVVASSQIVLPIKVVGMRVDEALPVIEKAIDQAVLSGQERLEIIHGTGTGRLKNAIRAYLKELPVVKRLTDGSIHEGGGNKTIVVFDVS